MPVFVHNSPRKVTLIMKKLTALAAFIITVQVMCGQVLPAEKLLHTLSIPVAKFDEWAAKKKFFLSHSAKQNDTLVKTYGYKPEVKKNKPVDSTMRRLLHKTVKESLFITYQTESASEFSGLTEELKKNGFYCNEEVEPLKNILLWQQNDLTVTSYVEIKDSIPLYSLLFYQQDFPDGKELYYADDLLYFTSHEYLVYYFGKENVKKDFYYFSGDELVNCSVLFINTARQVVFIWKDEVNKRTIDNLLFGGQQRLKSALESGKFVAESHWVFKSGIRAGMPLYELRLLNGDDIKFYGGHSSQTGMVLPEKKGKLDFKKEEIILGCMNCTDNEFAAATIMNADEAIEDGRILFILSVVLNPDAGNADPSKNTKPSMVNN